MSAWQLRRRYPLTFLLLYTHEGFARWFEATDRRGIPSAWG